MPKTSNVLLSLVAIGGGAYYYDQNVQPIWSQKQSIQIKQQQQAVTNQISKDSQKLSKKFNDDKKELENKTESALDSIKNSNIVNTITNSVGAQSPKTAELIEPKKSLPVRLVHSYIDTINSFGESTLSKFTSKDEQLRRQIEEDKSSWTSWLDSSSNKARNEAAEVKNSWFSFGESKKKEAEKEFNKSKNSWFSWGEDKKSELESTKNDLQDWNSKNINKASNKLNEASDKVASTFEAEKNNAINSYEAAKKNLDSFYQKVNDKLFTTDKEQQEHLTKAKDDFNSSLTNLRKYGSDLVDQIDKELYQPLKNKTNK